MKTGLNLACVVLIAAVGSVSVAPDAFAGRASTGRTAGSSSSHTEAQRRAAILGILATLRSEQGAYVIAAESSFSRRTEILRSQLADVIQQTNVNGNGQSEIARIRGLCGGCVWDFDSTRSEYEFRCEVLVPPAVAALVRLRAPDRFFAQVSEIGDAGPASVNAAYLRARAEMEIMRSEAIELVRMLTD